MIIYHNLEREMAQKGFAPKDLAKALDAPNINNYLNGRYTLPLDLMIRIKAALDSTLPLEILFDSTPHPPFKVLSARFPVLEKIMFEQGFSRRTLAEAIGSERSLLSRYLSGKYMFKLDTMLKIKAALNSSLPLDVLFKSAS